MFRRLVYLFNLKISLEGKAQPLALFMFHNTTCLQQYIKHSIMHRLSNYKGLNLQIVLRRQVTFDPFPTIVPGTQRLYRGGGQDGVKYPEDDLNSKQ